MYEAHRCSVLSIKVCLFLFILFYFCFSLFFPPPKSSSSSGQTACASCALRHLPNHLEACPRIHLIIITTGRRGQVRQRGALSGVVLLLPRLSQVPIGMHDKRQIVSIIRS